MCGGSSPLAPIVDTAEDIGGTIGDLGNQVDQAVNDNVPGGWALPAAVAVAVIAPEIAPELFAEAGGETAAGSEIGADIGSDVVVTPVEEPPVATPNAPTYDYSPNVDISEASPELDPTGSMASSTLNDITPRYDFSPETPISNAPQELDPTGSMSTATTSPTDIARALRLANTAKNLLGSRNTTQQQMQQSFNALNNPNRTMSGNISGTGLPTEYRAKNPFDFGQQQPVQDTLASLLRNNYGNS